MRPRGWAIECRISAEDPARGLHPVPGPHQRRGGRPPGPWVRVDAGVYEGGEVPLHYDPLMAKLIVSGGDRRRRDPADEPRALAEFSVAGVQTTIPFHRAVMRDPDFLAGRLSTAFVDAGLRTADGLAAPVAERARAAAVAAALRTRAREPEAAPRSRAAPSRWAMASRPGPGAPRR